MYHSKVDKVWISVKATRPGFSSRSLLAMGPLWVSTGGHPACWTLLRWRPEGSGCQGDSRAWGAGWRSSVIWGSASHTHYQGQAAVGLLNVRCLGLEKACKFIPGMLFNLHTRSGVRQLLSPKSDRNGSCSCISLPFPVLSPPVGWAHPASSVFWESL